MFAKIIAFNGAQGKGGLFGIEKRSKEKSAPYGNAGIYYFFAENGIGLSQKRKLLFGYLSDNLGRQALNREMLTCGKGLGQTEFAGNRANLIKK